MDTEEIAAASPTSPTGPATSDDPLQSSGTAPTVNTSTLYRPTRPVRNTQNYVPPTGNNEELKDDLSDFGFGAQKVNRLMKTREYHFDDTMQRPQHQTREDRENKRKGVAVARTGRSQVGSTKVVEPERAAKRVKIKGEKAEGLVIEGSGNWVLFNPLTHDFPIYPGSEVPALFQQYTRYEPGNARIVEFNLETSSVRLKTTPALLRNKAVEYTKTGPKLTEKATTESPPQPPAPASSKSPGRRRKKSEEDDFITANEDTDSLSTGVRTRANGAITRNEESAVKIKPEKDPDSGSESELTDLDQELEIAESQEGDDG